MVEIVKGLFPYLNNENTDPRKEQLRKMCLQLLAVAAGIVTTFLARSAIPAEFLPASAGIGAVIALGFLASGGSGLWNAVLTYLLEVKNIKERLATVADAKAEIADQVRKATGTDFIQRADALAKLESGSVSIMAGGQQLG
jgi:hypothetical protein